MPAIFDKKTKRMQRNRAANTLADFDFLLREVNENIRTILDEEINIKLPKALNLGCGTGGLNLILKDIAGIKEIINCDCACNMKKANIIADEEALPFKNDSFNLIVSTLSLHWTNDLISTLTQAHNILKDRGLFIATIFGGDTLHELRAAIMQGEIQTGVSPRISPFVHLKDAGGLLQKTGFHIPVANSETITVTYDNAFDLMHDLKSMGENNALIKRNKKIISRDLLDKIAQTYADMFAGEDGKIPATFEFITMTGWKN